jgi:hypothetical protein|tara:strand:- start:132 stop:443 length:312 start_codon:yes stop_codon:yes gene_type:complete
MERHLQEELEDIIIRPGDVIIDHLTGYVGIVLERVRRVDMFIDDVYFWEIRWTSNFTNKEDRKDHKKYIDISGYLEEATLKLSVLIGAVELHSATTAAGNNED